MFGHNEWKSAITVVIFNTIFVSHRYTHKLINISVYTQCIGGSVHVESLFQVAGEVGKAVGNLVNIMTDDEDEGDDDEDAAAEG